MEQGKQGDLVGRASESSTVRPVWGRRHLLRENKGGCVALSGHVSRTEHWPTKRAVFRPRGPSACYDIVSSADPSAAEEALTSSTEALLLQKLQANGDRKVQ